MEEESYSWLYLFTIYAWNDDVRWVEYYMILTCGELHREVKHWGILEGPIFVGLQPLSLCTWKLSSVRIIGRALNRKFHWGQRKRGRLFRHFDHELEFPQWNWWHLLPSEKKKFWIPRVEITILTHLWLSKRPGNTPNVANAILTLHVSSFSKLF